ncbi:MAG: hypothetical protein V1767_01045 [Chloroflexota bacterium]
MDLFTRDSAGKLVPKSYKDMASESLENLKVLAVKIANAPPGWEPSLNDSNMARLVNDSIEEAGKCEFWKPINHLLFMAEEIDALYRKAGDMGRRADTEKRYRIVPNQICTDTSKRIISGCQCKGVVGGF